LNLHEILKCRNDLGDYLYTLPTTRYRDEPQRGQARPPLLPGQRQQKEVWQLSH